MPCAQAITVPQPILRRFGVESTVRPSLAFYNTCEEVDAAQVNAIWKLKAGGNPGPIWV